MGNYLVIMPGKKYKDYRFYAFVALNLIASTLDIDINQKGLKEKLGPILKSQEGVSKSAIMYEIRSNHNMTNKVIDYLQDEELAVMEKVGGEYCIKITAQGIIYLREYSRFYTQIFKTEIAALYKFRATPGWVKEE